MAAITKYHRLTGLKTNLSSHDSGSWTSEVTVRAGFVRSEGCERRIFPRTLLVSTCPSSSFVSSYPLPSTCICLRVLILFPFLQWLFYQELPNTCIYQHQNFKTFWWYMGGIALEWKEVICTCLYLEGLSTSEILQKQYTIAPFCKHFENFLCLCILSF